MTNNFYLKISQCILNVLFAYLTIHYQFIIFFNRIFNFSRPTECYPVNCAIIALELIAFSYLF